MLETAKTLGARYEVQQTLHSSDTSTVTLAYDPQTHRSVVIKTAEASDFDAAATLLREREVLARLDHPGVVRCLDFFKSDGLVGLVLEHVPGTNLEQVLTERKRIDEKTACAWALQLADILDLLHQQRPAVLYRDLKPSNIMLRPDGRLVLVDFGASRLRNDAPKDTVALGTPGYAPPEQYGQGTDERADVYTLGVTLFELLSGRDPRDYNFVFPPLRELGVSVSPAVERAVQRATERDPRERFASVRALREALQPPRRNLTRMAAGILVSLGYAVAVCRTTDPVMRFLFVLSAFLAAVWAGAIRIREDASEAVRNDRPSWQRQALWLLAVGGCGLLGAAPLALSEENLNTHLRRLALDALHRPMPISMSAHALMPMVLFVGVLGFLSGRALTRRLPLALPLALAVGATALVFGHVALDTRQDTSATAVFNDPPALWTKTLGRGGLLQNNGRSMDITLRGTRVALRLSEREYQVLDVADGQEVFTGTTAATEPLRIFSNLIIEQHPDRLAGRSLETGKTVWEHSLPGVADRIKQDASTIYFLQGPRIDAIDPTTGQVRWTWNATDGTPSDIVASGHRGSGRGQASDIVMVAMRDGRTVVALDRYSGQPRWKRTLNVSDLRFTFPFGGRQGWITPEGMLVLDVQSGQELFKAPFDASAFCGLMVIGDHWIINLGSRLLGFESATGKAAWSVATPARLRVEGRVKDSALAVGNGGRLMLLDPRTGDVEWEWWPGDLENHLLLGDTAPDLLTCSLHVIWMQAKAGAPLIALNNVSGTLAWRHQVPPQTRVADVLSDVGSRSLLLLTYNAQQELTLTALPAPSELSIRQMPPSVPPTH